VDELVSYIRQFEEGKSMPGGTYGSNLSFLQTLTEAMKAVPNAVLLASLPESDKEAGGERGVAALRALEHYFARVQALWKPVATEEAFEIVRRRLFNRIEQQGAVEAVCQSFANTYLAHKDAVPSETTGVRYLDRLRSAYPIHPEVFDRLYEDWSALPGFQRTRGVLKMMAKVIHRLWKDGDSDLMILPSSLPLYDGDVRNEAIYYLATGWDPVVEKDIDGDRAEATEIDSRESLFGAVKACRRVARTVFFGSAPSGANPAARGVPVERIVLGCLQPDQPPARFRDALKRLQDRLTYLNVSNDRYWFDTKPNLRREMEERKQRFNDRDDVVPAIREQIGKTLVTGVFNAVHVFTPSADIPDDFHLRLIVLPPGDSYTRSGPEQATTAATVILRQRGEQPRLRQNRVLFLAADSEAVLRLKDQARALLAWRSIVVDIEESRLLVDQVQGKQAKQLREAASETFQRALRDTYRWLLVPYQRATPKGIEELAWEKLLLNPAATSISKEIEQVAQDNEAVITQWAPVHLHRLLKDWFWKADAPEAAALDVWQKTCQYLYMPRLAASPTFQSALAAGTAANDFYGLAYGLEDGNYRGFSFGQATTPTMDASLLLIEPAAAAAYAVKIAPKPTPEPDPEPGPGPGPKPIKPPIGPTPPVPPLPTPVTRLFASVTLDPIQGALQYAKIADEIVALLAGKPGARVQIKLDISATDAAGYDEQTRRAVKENAKALKFDQVDFE
jgi:predicted AAA+ superfamily ATPase